MASKKSDRGAGPGTYESGGVRCTMDSPFKSGAGVGSQKNMSGTFDAPRAGGDNGLPTKIYDSLGGPSATPKAGSAASSPSAQGPTRPGTK